MGRSIEIKLESNLYLETCAYIEDTQVTLDNTLWDSFSDAEKEFVKDLKSNESYHLNEFPIHGDTMDFDEIVKFMDSLDISTFNYYYHHENFSLESFEEKDKNELEEVKALSLSIIKKARPFVEKHMKVSEYDDVLNKIYDRTKLVPPLTVAQEIMGKSFMRVSNYEKYYFVPLKYCSNKPFRVFDDKILLQIIPMNEKVEPITIEDMASALKVIGDPTRLKIISLLSTKAMYGKEIAESLNMKAPTITHHIEQLNKIGLLHLEKYGQIKSFSLNHRRYKEILEQLKGIGAQK